MLHEQSEKRETIEVIIMKNGLTYKGRVTNINELPNDAEIGDMYSVGIFNYVYDGTKWVLC